MNVDEVGKWRCCPACGGGIKGRFEVQEAQQNNGFEFEDVRCSGCDRPWIACPCPPVEHYPECEDPA